MSFGMPTAWRWAGVPLADWPVGPVGLTRADQMGLQVRLQLVQAARAVRSAADRDEWSDLWIAVGIERRGPGRPASGA